MRRHHQHTRTIHTICLGLVVLLVSACGSTSATVTTAKLPGITATATTVSDESATVAPTAGPPCTGSLWSSTITFVGPNIPLPPLTVYGLAETFPPANGWVGHYLRLCTSGNLDTIRLFIAEHMPAEGWQYGNPPSDCLCGGMSVWSRANDSRLIQFDDHPYLLNGTVQWGVSVYTRG